MRLVRLFSLALAPLVAALAIALSTVPVAAAQGGCNTYTGPTGSTPATYNVGICINDRGSGTKAYPDYYVNTRLPSSCSIQLELWDGSGHRYGPIFRDSGSCNTGHHPGTGSWCQSDWSPHSFGDSVSIHSFFRLFINGQERNPSTTNSPAIGLTFTGMAHCP